MVKFVLSLAAGLSLLSQHTAIANDNNPPYAAPIFYPFSQPDASDYSDYRPVLNADATFVVFERTFADAPNDTKLYIANLATNTVQRLVDVDSERPDWCWNRATSSLTTGPLAFSNSDGIYIVNVADALNGAKPKLRSDTAGMVYPSWYPDCRSLAVDVGQNVQVSGERLTAQIDAHTGKVLAAPLANDEVWAGFPSVNQANPNLVAFAGQFIGASNYYNELLNYTWVTDRSRNPPLVAPMDRRAPAGPGFFQQFQARAGWWSPDAKWFAFESNRTCDDIDGLTYAIFIQDANGKKPAMQVTSCEWNANHPKWFPPGSTGGKTMLIAALAQPSANPFGPYHTATLDVTAFVARR
jgi:hypothetical protein